uniref:Uncharacterized protein n=1 Tax=Panagrolaimus sp. PS1159 TaxID=55785 RepID=A0AC35FZA5_9BILA
MDQIESIVQKLRNRGKRLPKSKAPLTLERLYFNKNDDIVGTFVTLSTVSMDQIESTVQKLRNRGKRLPKSKAPLTRQFSRAQSPLTKTAISVSAETLTVLKFTFK